MNPMLSVLRQSCFNANKRFFQTSKKIFKASDEDFENKICDALSLNEPPQIEKKKVFYPDIAEDEEAIENCKLIVEGQSSTEELAPVQLPDLLKTRRVRIFQPPKNVMQSGTYNTHGWMIDFDKKENWENPCVGWSSGSDPLQGVRVSFMHKEDAIAFCEKSGWRWWVHETWKIKPFKVRSYADNFHHTKRTRVSTK